MLEQQCTDAVEEIGARGTGRLDHGVLHAFLQETSRKEAEGRHKKWEYLKELKARTSQQKQQRRRRKAIEEATYQLDLHAELRALGHMQPSTQIEEELVENKGGDTIWEEEKARRPVKGFEASRRPKKRRGKRQRGNTLFEIVTLNSSGLPQLQDALAVKKRGK